MPAGTISVTLAVGVAPYQKTLASGLLRAAMLRRVFDFGPGFDIQMRDPGPDSSLQTIERFPLYTFVNRAAWAVSRRLPGEPLLRPAVALKVCLADRLLANRLPPTTIFHGRTSVCLNCLQAAKRQGTVTLVEIASRHPRHWKQSDVEECRRLGINSREGSADLGEFLMRRREREFEICDRIVVPSTVARQSFADLGYGEKTEIVPSGVDSDFFIPRCEAPISPRFRVCYVGRVEPVKGVGYLLEAWKRLALPHAELVLVGEVRSQMKLLLKSYADSSLRCTGVLPPEGVAQCYRESDLFVLPSPNEGFGIVLLEAMASGLPVIGTDMTGAVECVQSGEQGFVVPARDADALAESILWCYRHPEQRRAMGRAARARVGDEFTLEHYNQRVIALYRSLAGVHDPSRPVEGVHA